MKKNNSSLLLVLTMIVLIVFGSKAVGQQKNGLPPELNSHSSLAETLVWLNDNAFPLARVGLKAPGGIERGSFGLPSNSISAARLVLSPGFQLANVNGCIITLRNDNVSMIYVKGFYGDFNPPKKNKPKLTPKVAMMFLPLDRISVDKGKNLSRNTDRGDESEPEGWITRFNERGFFRHSIFQLEIGSAEKSEVKQTDLFQNVSFGFDSMELAAQFNAALFHAVRICASK